VKLVLGVADMAYSDAGSGITTTGDVAEILEARYHVMEVFYETRQDLIADWLADAVSDQISDLLRGAPAPRNIFGDAEQKIERAFRGFLDADEMQAILPLGQQITAAAIGMSKRFKAGHTKGYKARPAFIDTGTYQAAFRAWIETDATADVREP
jgi:hypothetical protein